MGCGASSGPVASPVAEDAKTLASLSVSELSLLIHHINGPKYAEYAEKFSENAVDGAMASEYLSNGDINELYNDVEIANALHRKVITKALSSRLEAPNESCISLNHDAVASESAPSNVKATDGVVIITADVERVLWTKPMSSILADMQTMCCGEFVANVRDPKNDAVYHTLLKLNRRANVLAFKNLSAWTSELTQENQTLIDVMNQVLQATFYCAPYLELLCRTSALLDIATRLLSVMWLQLYQMTEKANENPSLNVCIDEAQKEEWLTKIRNIHSMCSHCASSASPQGLLLGLKLSEFETGLLSLPDPSASCKVISASLKVVKGLIESVVTISISSDLLESVGALFALGVNIANSNLAGDCYSELCLSNATWAKVIRPVTPNVLTAQGTSYTSLSSRQLIEELKAHCMDGKHQDSDKVKCVRWELKASFAATLGNIVQNSAEKGDLLSLDLQGICDPLIELLSAGDSNQNHEASIQSSVMLLVQCADALLHPSATQDDDLQAWVTFCVEIARSEVDALAQRLHSKVCGVKNQITQTQLGYLKFDQEDQSGPELHPALVAICAITSDAHAAIQTARNSCTKTQDICAEALRLLRCVVDVVSCFERDSNRDLAVGYLSSAIRYVQQIQEQLQDLGRCLEEVNLSDTELAADRVLKKVIDHQDDFFALNLEDETRQMISDLKLQIEDLLEAVDLPSGRNPPSNQSALARMIQKLIRLTGSLGEQLLDEPPSKAVCVRMMDEIRNPANNPTNGPANTCNDMLTSAVDSLISEAQPVLAATCELMGNLLGQEDEMEQLELGCSALIEPMFQFCSTWRAGQEATLASEGWRARLQAAFSAHLILYVLHQPEYFGLDHSDLPGKTIEIKHQLRKAILQRSVVESSVAVRKMLQNGPEIVAELSLQKQVSDTAQVRKVEWQESWKEAEEALLLELEGTIEQIAHASVVRGLNDQSSSAFEQQKQVLRHKQTQRHLEMCKQNLKGMTAQFGIQVSLLKHIESEVEKIKESLTTMDGKLNEILNVVTPDHGYYMYVALQVAPVLHGSMTIDLTSKQHVCVMQKTLSDQEKSLKHQRHYPIRFAELSSATPIDADLRVGAFSLVWSGLGCGWDTTANPPRILEAVKSDGLQVGRWFWLDGDYDPEYGGQNHGGVPYTAADGKPDIKPESWRAYSQEATRALESAYFTMLESNRTFGKLIDLYPDNMKAEREYQVWKGKPFNVENPNAPEHVKGKMSVAGYRADLHEVLEDNPSMLPSHIESEMAQGGLRVEGHFFQIPSDNAPVFDRMVEWLKDTCGGVLPPQAPRRRTVIRVVNDLPPDNMMKVKPQLQVAKAVKARGPQSTDTERLDAAKLVRAIRQLKTKPSVFVVALKYGAEKEAYKLRKQLDEYSISTSIVWVQADLMADKSLIRFIESAISIVNSNKLGEQDVTNRQLMDLGNREVGCFVSKRRQLQDNLKTTWNPHCDLNLLWPDKAVHFDSGFLASMIESSDLHMQSSDLVHVDAVKSKLTAVGLRALAVCPEKKTQDANAYTRCRTVALQAYSDLVLKGSAHFSAVVRVANEEDWKKAKELAQQDSSGFILLWADMLVGLPALTKADTESQFEYKRADNIGEVSELQTICVNGKQRLVEWADHQPTPAFCEDAQPIKSVTEGEDGCVKLPNVKFDNPRSACAWTKDLSKKLISMFEEHPHVHLLLTSDSHNHSNREDVTTEIANALDCSHNELLVRLSEADDKDSIKSMSGCPIRFFATVPDPEAILESNDGTSVKRVDLLEIFDHDAVEQAVRDALPDNRPIAALYHDWDKDGAWLLVRICISDVAYLHKLRDSVLSKRAGHALTKRLNELATLYTPDNGTSGLIVQADLSQFASKYEQSVLDLDSLTPHQVQKLRECEGATTVLVEAAAGAGKTYVALHQMQQVLLHEVMPGSSKSVLPSIDNNRHKVLFVAKNRELCMFIAQWICRRWKSLSDEKLTFQILSRLHILYGEQGLQDKVYSCAVEYCSKTKSSLIKLNPIEEGSGIPYDLVVVDEAHHLYTNKCCRDIIDKYSVHADTKRMLLSDVSQSHGREIDWPEHTLVRLTQVVRCSERIMAGAMAFQLNTVDGKTKKEDTVSQHRATGPPLKTFLFDIPDGDDRMEFYANKTLEAFQYIIQEYPDLVLHNRLAILVPNEVTRNAFQEPLAAALNKVDENRTFKIISAALASSTRPSSSDDKHTGDESVVLDTIANFDGLERLLVIGVDLDQIIKDPNVDTHESRSLLYRALTRAHMLVVLVNELLHGGWLEFLMGVELDNQTEDDFNVQEEKDRQDHEAARRILDAALQVALNTQNFKSSYSRKNVHKIIADNLAMLTVPERSRITQEQLEADVEKITSAWHQAEQDVLQNVTDAAKGFGFELDEETMMMVLADTVRRNREKHGTDGNDSKEAVRQALFSLIPSKLKAAANKLDIPLSDDLLNLSPEFKSSVEQQLDAMQDAGLQVVINSILESWKGALDLTNRVMSEVATEKQVTHGVTESSHIVAAITIVALDVFDPSMVRLEIPGVECEVKAPVRDKLLGILWGSFIEQEVQHRVNGTETKPLCKYVADAVPQWATDTDQSAIQHACDIWFAWECSITAAFEQKDTRTALIQLLNKVGTHLEHQQTLMTPHTTDRQAEIFQPNMCTWLGWDQSISDALTTALKESDPGYNKSCWFQESRKSVNLKISVRQQLSKLKQRLPCLERNEYFVTIQQIAKKRTLVFTDQELSSMVERAMVLKQGKEGMTIRRAVEMLLPMPQNIWDVDGKSAKRKDDAVLSFDPYRVLQADLEAWVLEKLRRYDEEPGFAENRNRKFIDKQGYENHLRDHSQAKFRDDRIRKFLVSFSCENCSHQEKAGVWICSSCYEPRPKHPDMRQDMYDKNVASLKRQRQREAERERQEAYYYAGGCVFAQESFYVSYVTFRDQGFRHEKSSPFAPFWPSAQGCLDFCANVLPRVLECTTSRKLAPAASLLRDLFGMEINCLPSLDALLIAACVRDDTNTVSKLAQSGASVHASDDSSPLIVASRLGNWRTVALLLSLGADTNHRDCYGKLALTHAAEGCFLPTVEVLLGCPAPWSALKLKAAELSSVYKDRFQLAMECYVKMRLNVAEATKGEVEGTVQLNHRAIHGKVAFDAAAFERGTDSPTSLILPWGAEEQFLKRTVELAEGEDYAYYIAHADAMTDLNEKAKRIQCLAASHAAEDPDGKPFEELKIFVCSRCIPQWDAYLKWSHLRLMIHGGTLRSARLAIMLDEAFFRRYWCMEELLLFAKFQGYGALRLLAPETCLATEIPALLNHLLAKVGIDAVGAGGGPYLTGGIFNGCVKPAPTTISCAASVPLQRRQVKEGSIATTFFVGHSPTYLPRNYVLQKVQEAFDVYTTIIGEKFEQVGKEEGADIRMYWCPPPRPVCALPGEAEYFLSGSVAKTTQDGCIHLNPNKRWAIDPSEELMSGTVLLKPVALHEIGHALGLPHSTVKGSVMYPLYQPQLESLHEADVSALSQLHTLCPLANDCCLPSVAQAIWCLHPKCLLNATSFPDHTALNVHCSIVHEQQAKE